MYVDKTPYNTPCWIIKIWLNGSYQVLVTTDEKEAIRIWQLTANSEVIRGQLIDPPNLQAELQSPVVNVAEEDAEETVVVEAEKPKRPYNRRKGKDE